MNGAMMDHLARDVRYTDRMIVDDPELYMAACDYAENYAGNWEVMLSVQRVLFETGTLPVAVARLTLNALRADPDAQDLRPVRRFPEKCPRRELPKKESKPKPIYRSPITLRTIWKLPFVMSTQSNAYVVHLVRANEERKRDWAQYSRITWDSDRLNYSVHVHAWCSRGWTQHAYMRNRSEGLGAILLENPGEYKVCNTCLRNRAKFYGSEVF